MFCDETVKEVYKCMTEYGDYDDNSFLDCYHALVYHVAKGYRLILKTQTYYISLGYDGVKIASDKENIVLPDEYMESCINVDEDGVPWVDFENTLFVGERLIDVKESDGVYHAVFDDFVLKLIPCENENNISSHYNKNHLAYNRVYGCERLLTQKCVCGGNGEILLDFVSDYVVRCNKCKKSTRAGMNVIDAIIDWNEGKLHCDLNDIEFE